MRLTIRESIHRRLQLNQSKLYSAAPANLDPTFAAKLRDNRRRIEDRAERLHLRQDCADGYA